jgi:hypothetical protein
MYVSLSAHIYSVASMTTAFKPKLPYWPIHFTNYKIGDEASLVGITVISVISWR